MQNSYQQQLIEYYMKQCNSLKFSQTIYPRPYVSALENSTGFIRLNIVNQVGEPPVSNATITIYVTDGIQRDIPVMHLITTINPIRIELPMANDLGTLIVGPEYDLSTYNIRVDAFGYFSRNLYNIRLFPNTTTEFKVDMIPVTNLQAQPLIEERFDFPSHPRDELN